LEAGAKRLADAALENGLCHAIKVSLHKLKTSIESLSEQVAPVQAAYRQERRDEAHKAAQRSKQERRDEPSAGYESLASNARLVEPIAHAEARMASLFACAKEYQGAPYVCCGSWCPGRRARRLFKTGEALLVADVLYRPEEFARDAVLKFLKDEVRVRWPRPRAKSSETIPERVPRQPRASRWRSAFLTRTTSCGGRLLLNGR
jgi:hypothetical protein